MRRRIIGGRIAATRTSTKNSIRGSKHRCQHTSRIQWTGIYVREADTLTIVRRHRRRPFPSTFKCVESNGSTMRLRLITPNTYRDGLRRGCRPDQDCPRLPVTCGRIFRSTANGAPRKYCSKRVTSPPRRRESWKRTFQLKAANSTILSTDDSPTGSHPETFQGNGGGHSSCRQSTLTGTDTGLAMTASTFVSTRWRQYSASSTRAAETDISLFVE